MESDAAAVRFREGTTTAAGAVAAPTPRGRASVIVRGMARRGGSLRRSLKHLTIGGRGVRDANSASGRKSEGSSSGEARLASGGNAAPSRKNGEENVEMLEMRRNGVSDDDNGDDGDKVKSTWSERYSTWRRSLRRKKESQNAEPLPPAPDDAVAPNTCCSFSRRR